MKSSKREEEVVSELLNLYKMRGYKRYKPGCFEELSLYQENKDFLIGKNVIAFSDMSGRLLAMRPDVTLSLIRHNNAEQEILQKFYYNEKVYRQTAGSKDFKEINQVGVEVIGKVDEASVAEVALLICQTLSAVGDSFVLDISHMGFVEGLLELFVGYKEEVSQCLVTKNLHDFKKIADKARFDGQSVKLFGYALNLEGNAKQVIKRAQAAELTPKMQAALYELEGIVGYLDKFGYGDYVTVNFSAVSNADYYNGIIFNGYINGVPRMVLSGGRYDKLLQKMNKNGGAIGFALYLGEIERYFKQDTESVDTLIIYDGETQSGALELSQKLISEGKSVAIAPVEPDGLRYGELIKLSVQKVKL